MSICESEENRKKLAWLVPGYILLAWFFCVLFQPLSIRNSSASSFDPRRGWLPSTRNDNNYRLIYLNPDGNDNEDVCRGNGSVITLEPGEKSAALIRLSPGGWYHYRPFNCSVRVVAGPGLDGVSAVVEEMDLREHEDDVRQPGGHWGSSVCLDYLEAYTESSVVRNKLCGEWHVEPGDRLTSHGPRQTLVGYCYDDRSGHSCETRSIFLNVVLDSEFGRGFDKPTHGIKHRRRTGFTVAITGYRHASDEKERVIGEEVTLEGSSPIEQDSGSLCSPDEFSCPAQDFSVHNGRPHCIWDALRCDTHLNCGFLLSGDEQGCGNKNVLSSVGGAKSSIHTWSISTMTLLIIVYLAIVLVLVMVTMVLLRWHKALRTPLDVLAESRGADTALSVSNHHPGLATSAAHASASAENRRRGTVSIIVAYRPQHQLLLDGSGVGGEAMASVASAEVGKTTEAPPSYDSLFSTAVEASEEEQQQHPPNYNHLLRATFNIRQPRSSDTPPSSANAATALDSVEDVAQQSNLGASADSVQNSSPVECPNAGSEEGASSIMNSNEQQQENSSDSSATATTQQQESHSTSSQN